jgi:predicted alpha/beta-hydrolase family hydrolase
MSLSSEIRIDLKNDALTGDLSIPEASHGVILFAHGSGSSRLSPRNGCVANYLNECGFATLLIDLLSSAEEDIDQYSRHLRFDIPLLAQRLILAIEWLSSSAETKELPIGLFGASTGSAGAILAAVEARRSISAVVSRGGRPDLAWSHLHRLKAPTLLIVGGEDDEVLDLNKHASTQMRCPHKIAIVPGATHLFEEPGTLERVAQLASDWFSQYVGPPMVRNMNYEVKQ